MRVNPHRKIIQLTGATACVVGGMLIGLPALFASGSHRDAAPGSDRLGVLSRPSQPRDRLPGAARRAPFAAQHYPSARGSRLVYDQGGDRLFVVPGLDRQICLVRVSTDAAAPPTSGTCNPRSRLKKSAIVLAYPRDDGTTLVIGVAADGWQTVSYGSDVAAIRSNTFLVRGHLRNKTLTLQTHDGSTRKVKLPL
jgi:hypothetical protein